ncbi:SsgA family sporulation/cell division regulator [Nakamurella sp. YIM 132087]|uniref:SsgA family sporulation/cell division regulator n=1 Tax=Nakamurella alba TaxID=2665158 RepID=A0A7K1FQH5_9ACTN|nr:SsgA family sporulation/cell division regulator [Nakamurella alba]MTD16397.1 SsgA family sporulation/cell division regulator [Nakamurella alba]
MAGQPITQRHLSVAASTVMTMVTDWADIPVDADLQYHSRDPFAVRMVFSMPGTPAVEWVFARDLIIAGLVGPSGHGDVQVFPGEQGIVLELNSPGGQAQLVAERPALVRFVQDMLSAVPLGGEDTYYDIDGEIAGLVDFEVPGSAQV